MQILIENQKRFSNKSSIECHHYKHEGKKQVDSKDTNSVSFYDILMLTMA